MNAMKRPGEAPSISLEDMMVGAVGGDRLALARMLTMVERGGDNSAEVARVSYRSKQRGQTVGITGAPGAGKSTLVEKLISVAREGGKSQVAVIAVDPTSPFSGGAILGDRIRMQSHAGDKGVFIRSMASRGHLGGLSIAVPEAMRLLEAVGMDPVIVETVGVGQVEIEVASATDTTVVVLNPGWGDAIQANKAGILEIADILVVNKADRPGAKEAVRDLQQMLDMAFSLGIHPRATTKSTDASHDVSQEMSQKMWRPPVLETVASTGEGIPELWSAVKTHRVYLEESGEGALRRRKRAERSIALVLEVEMAKQLDKIRSSQMYLSLVDATESGHSDPYEAAEKLMREADPDR